MTSIFTKRDVKRKFLTIESKTWSDIADLQKEIDRLESNDCLIVDIKTLKSHEINDNLYLYSVHDRILKSALRSYRDVSKSL